MNKANQEKPNALYGFIYLTSKRGGREKKKEKKLCKHGKDSAKEKKRQTGAVEIVIMLLYYEYMSR